MHVACWDAAARVAFELGAGTTHTPVNTDNERNAAFNLYNRLRLAFPHVPFLCPQVVAMAIAVLLECLNAQAQQTVAPHIDRWVISFAERTMEVHAG